MSTPRDQRWSPFARPPWRDSRAAAEAVLRAREIEECALDELTQQRYAAVRDRNPQVGLPRATTIERVCGSWNVALEQAAALACTALRLNFVTE